MSAKSHYFGKIKSEYQGLNENDIPEYQETPEFRFDVRLKTSKTSPSRKYYGIKTMTDKKLNTNSLMNTSILTTFIDCLYFINSDN